LADQGPLYLAFAVYLRISFILALLIEEHNRMQSDRSTSLPAIDEQQQSLGTALTTTIALASVPITPAQDVIMLPTQNRQQNVTCPIPCFLKSDCQTCIEAQCM
jgi:hypothetical protein